MNTIPTQQPGLFDYESRLKKLERGPDPLARLNARIDWTIFRQDLERAVAKEARGPGGRPRHDVVMMFKGTSKNSTMFQRTRKKSAE